MRGSRAERVGGWSGVGFAVLSLVWMAWTIVLNTPEVQASRTTIVRFYSDHGNRAPFFILSVVLMLAGFVLLWFVASVRAKLEQTRETHQCWLTSRSRAGSPSPP